MNMKGKTKMEKGITLIALIITIVVLLILAAVAIAAIQNENILGHANNAAVKYNDSVTNEQGTLGEYENFLKNHVGGEAKDEVTMLSGDGQTYYTLAPSTLSFRSSADINDFQEVQVNGETIDPSNYTITEGSTIVNLSIDYLKTLGEDDYSISIVSKTGSPSAGFSVVAPDVNSHGFYYNQPYTGYMDYFGTDVAIFVREDGTADSLARNLKPDANTYTVEGDTIVANNPTFGMLHFDLSDDGTELYCTELSTTFKLGEEEFMADDDYIYAYDSSLGGYEVTTINKTKTSYGSIKTNINGKPIVTMAGEGFKWCKSMQSITIPSSVVNIGFKAFYGCYSLITITFEGTMEQWNAISKGESWNTDVPATEVICSDGTVTL